MIPAFDCEFDFDGASMRLAALSADVTARMRSLGTKRIPADTKIEASAIGGRIIFVKDGAVKLLHDDRVVFTFEQGECVLVGTPMHKIKSPDFAVDIEVYASDSDGVTGLLDFFGGLWLSLISNLVVPADEIFPAARGYETGDVIIEQGTRAEQVYTLIDGEADVFVNGVKVGDVLTNEFFGVIAAVTNTPRSASVIARSPCSVLAVNRTQFRELIRVRPALVEKLITELGRSIVDLNAHVVGLTASRTSELSR